MNWNVLTSLHKIYIEGKVKSNKTLLENYDIKHLIDDTRELYEHGQFIVKTEKFNSYYEKYHLNNYKKYDDFLASNNLKKPQTRFEEKDINLLIDIKQGIEDKSLCNLRNQIIEAEETVRGVSLMFFKNEKYLLRRTALTNAVKQLLEIDELADDKDQQYIYILECHSPKLIVLCENLDFLKRPNQFRQNNIELWYAGGKNINKLDYANVDRGLKIYYSCDWDYNGLKIYEDVKQKIPEIKLLYPNGTPKQIEDTEHRSLWRSTHDIDKLSELSKNLFNSKEQKLIEQLIINDQWIIEESNDLVKMTAHYL